LLFAVAFYFNGSFNATSNNTKGIEMGPPKEPATQQKTLLGGHTLPGDELFEQIPPLPKHTFGESFEQDVLAITKWLGLFETTKSGYVRIVNMLDFFNEVFIGHPNHSEKKSERPRRIRRGDLPFIWVINEVWDQFDGEDIYTTVNKYRRYRATQHKIATTPPEAEVTRGEIGRVINTRMNQFGLTSVGLSEKSKENGPRYSINSRLINTVLNDQMANPTLINLIKIADVLEVELWQLLKPGFADELRDLNPSTVPTHEKELISIRDSVLKLLERIKTLEEKTK